MWLSIEIEMCVLRSRTRALDMCEYYLPSLDFRETKSLRKW